MSTTRTTTRARSVVLPALPALVAVTTLLVVRSGIRTVHPSGVIVNPDGVGPREFTFGVLPRISGDNADTGDPADALLGTVAQTRGAASEDGALWLVLAAVVLALVAVESVRATRLRPAHDRWGRG